jgi:hypothetical protein
MKERLAERGHANGFAYAETFRVISARRPPPTPTDDAA